MSNIILGTMILKKKKPNKPNHRKVLSGLKIYTFWYFPSLEKEINNKPILQHEVETPRWGRAQDIWFDSLVEACETAGFLDGSDGMDDTSVLRSCHVMAHCMGSFIYCKTNYFNQLRNRTYLCTFTQLN